MRAKLLAIATVAPALTGCATVEPPRPAVLSYDRTDCAASPDLASATSLVPEKNTAVWTKGVLVSATTQCIIHNGVRLPYVVFALPPAGQAKLIELGSVLGSASIFAPDVALLNGSGKVTRSFHPDSYMFRTGLYSVQFVPQSEERYALVTSNPALVGRKHDTIVAGVSSTYIYTGYGGMNWRSGNEAALSQAFSYDGVVQAKLFRPDKK